MPQTTTTMFGWRVRKRIEVVTFLVLSSADFSLRFSF